jgi:shikimate dehydrogenase
MTHPHEYPVITRAAPTMYFFGVTTGQSSSRVMFPNWAQILNLDSAQLVGVDLPINAPPEDYRRAVWQIRHDPLSLGALITTHKINVLNAARDLFDELTQDAELCGEVSCIYRRDGRLIGHATDPTFSGLSMRQFIPAGYWRENRADVLCLGAGGSAVAIVVHFLLRADPADRPRRIVIVNRSIPRLDGLRTLVEERLKPDNVIFDFIHNADPRENDRLLGELPAGSLVINATGMGKDTPGSPITDAGIFPQNGIAWELNYRGELDFLQQARAQEQTRRLIIEDGWYYFLVGWASIVGTIFDVEITPPLFDQLAQAAQAIRG